LESLWNFLQLSYNQLKLIQQLSRSNTTISQICPKILKNGHFWWPTSNNHNSQTIWTIAMKIWHKQYKQVIYNFVINKIHNKHHFHCAIILTDETIPKPLTENIEQNSISLHTRNEIWAQPMLPTVHKHHIQARKYNGHPQINSFHAFINLFR
jgi:hypothetical protein